MLRHMEKKYEMPYFCGVPLGDGTQFLNAFEKARAGERGEAGNHPGRGKSILILHEQVFANSLRENLRTLVPDVQ